MIELSGGVQGRREYFAGHVALSSITVLVLLFDTTKMALDANRAHADHPVRCGANGHAERPGLAPDRRVGARLFGRWLDLSAVPV
jgi:hypothetical protein